MHVARNQSSKNWEHGGEPGTRVSLPSAARVPRLRVRAKREESRGMRFAAWYSVASAWIALLEHERSTRLANRYKSMDGSRLRRFGTLSCCDNCLGYMEHVVQMLSEVAGQSRAT
eukprot:scaffold6392_cov118-Isochrysis_galbana.AAC.8